MTKPERCILRVYYPTPFGSQVSIRGSGGGLSWDKGTPATYHADQTDSSHGWWELEVDVSGSRVEFKPLLNDDVWCKGANYITPTDKSSFDVYPFFFSEQGTLHHVHDYYSHILNNARTINIYLPPSYNENTYKRYPVLFMNDGHNLFESAGSYNGTHWHIADTMNWLCSCSAIQETIIVGVVPVSRVNEYLPTQMTHHMFGTGGGDAHKYFQFLLDELRPYLVDTYRTHRPLDHVGIAGSSFGGACALYGFLAFPDNFTVCGAYSPSLLWDGRLFFRLVHDDHHVRPGSARLYIDNGHPGDGFTTVGEMNELIWRKIHDEAWLGNLQYLRQTGWNQNHNEDAWAKRSPRALIHLLHDYNRVPWGMDDV